MAIPPVDTSSTRPVQQPLTIGAATDINERSIVCQLPIEVVLQFIAFQGTLSSSLRTSLAATCRHYYHLLREPEVLQALTRLQFLRIAQPLTAGRELQNYEGRCRFNQNLSSGVYASHTLFGHTDWVIFVAVLLDGRIVSGSYDGTLMIWDPTGQTPPVTLRGHTDAVNFVAVLPNGNIVSGSPDKTLMIWDPTGQTPPITLRGYTDAAHCIAVLLDGKIVSGSFDTLMIWDIAGQMPPVTLRGHTDTVSFVAVLPDGRIVSGSNDGTLRVWDPAGQTPPITLRGHTDAVRCIAVLLDGKIVSGSFDYTLIIWDIAGQMPLVTLRGHTGEVRYIAVLPDGNIVSGSNDGTLRVWDPAGQTPPITLRGHTDAVRCIAVLLDGKIVSGSYDGTLRVWDFFAPPIPVFIGIADLLTSADPLIAADAMERFNRMPQAARNHIYGELYLLIQPSLSNDYWGCAEQIFHDRDPQQRATPEQKAQAIRNYIAKRQ